jgi:DNA helicase II / ATP-dependent DNA helicase PcrA
MFVWANDLVEKEPSVLATIRDRFPILFIDEAQDNNELQSSFLYRIFSKGETAVTRQRLGDGNQAIYDFVSAEAAKTDRFPDEDIRLRLPHSHRFADDIANLVDSFGINPYGMKGLHESPSPKRHTIFLFDESQALAVLEHYAQILVETFTHCELRDGTFTAVGQVHRPREDSSPKKHPHYLAHYWPPYEPTLAGGADKPDTFPEYVIGSQSKASLVGEVFVAVEGFARGILRLASILSDEPSFKSYSKAHRQIVDLLSSKEADLDEYLALSERYALELTPLSFSDWENSIRKKVVCVAEAVSGSEDINGEAEEFLSWKDASSSSAVRQSGRSAIINYFAYPSEDPLVRIRVGSIHAAKGETHTATLVLDTFWKKHNLSALKEWLIGSNTGYSKCNGSDNFSRLKTHYVAMTRPTDLLCLAIKRETFQRDDGEMNREEIRLLEERGWDVVLIGGVPEEIDNAPC